MNQEYFDEWADSVSLSPTLREAFGRAMSLYGNADRVLPMATTRGFDEIKMFDLLKSQGMVGPEMERLNTLLSGGETSGPPVGFLPIPQIPQSRNRVANPRRPGVIRPVSPVFAPSQPQPGLEPKVERRRWFGRKDPEKTPSTDQGWLETVKEKKWWIVGGLVVLLVLMALGYFWFGTSSTPQYDFSSNPSFATIPSNPVSSPDVFGAQQLSADPAVTFSEPTPEPDRWQQFVALNRQNAETTGPFLDKPSNWKDIFVHFPTRWFLWIAFLYPIWTLLKQDRLAGEELTDVKAAKRGLWALFIGVLCAGLLSALITYVAVNIIGASIEIPRYLFISMGIVVNLFVQWTAAMNGRKDYSTFSIGGLFFTGVLVVWWFTPNLIMTILGSLFMGAGIWLQNIEMRRTHQGWAGHMTALVMIVMFAGVTILIYFLGGLIPVITPAMPWIQQFAYAAIYSGRLFIGAIVGLLVAFSVGDQVSTAIMPPSVAGGVSLAGSKSDDDMSHKYDVNMRFDAMAYAIMLLYPLATAAWYLSKFIVGF